MGVQSWFSTPDCVAERAVPALDVTLAYLKGKDAESEGAHLLRDRQDLAAQNKALVLAWETLELASRRTPTTFSDPRVADWHRNFQ